MENFKTTHNLDFYSRHFSLCPSSIDFKVGTCNGLFKVKKRKYIIIAIINNHKNNGHFQDVLEWFENSCKRDKYDLVVAEIWNDRLKRHLIDKRGFEEYKELNGVIKSYKKMI